jgi:hypothetical protein
MDELRVSALAVLRDCNGMGCEKLRTRLRYASSAQEIWMARSDIFQIVASQHCQSQAAMRINGLLPAFEGWLPQKMLAAI